MSMAGIDARSAARGSILLIRPETESRQLAQALAPLAADVIVFPTLEIRPLDPGQAALACIDMLERYALAVFVSVNAVRCGLALIRARRAWPSSTRVAAVGAATAQALAEAGFEDVVTPESGHDSEALLVHPALREVRDARILLVRGEGGREHLADALRARGAQVDYLEAYRRTLPQCDAMPVRRLLAQGRVRAVVAASAQGVGNLLQLLDEDAGDIVRRVPLLVHHPRIAAAAQALGFSDVRLVAADACALLPALRACLTQP